MDELTQPLVKLERDRLNDLPQEVARPSYQKDDLSPGIVHIGVGNFHRAHQGFYLHRLMQEGLAHDFAIVGAGVRSADKAMREKLLSQDCLSTLIELDPKGTSAEVTGPMMDFVPVEEGNAALISQMAQREIRIVSLTVTEGGYFTGADGAFDGDHPDILHDAAHPGAPRTAFGAILAALTRRHSAGLGPFTVQSCDNLRGNGAITRAAVLGLAELQDAALARWIAEHVTFPNAVVDCIVPATGPAEIAAARTFGIADSAPVTHENFRQWVMDDAFCAGRPEWEKVGATFTGLVHDYEAMKIRILNAGHQVLANAGELLSLETIVDCIDHPLIGPFFRAVQHREITPHVKPVPEMAPLDYLALVERRFANPAIRDTVRRVAFDGSARHTGFVLPIVRDALAAGAPVEGLALVEALWARMCAGEREDGTAIAPNDPHWAALRTRAQAARSEPRAWINPSGPSPSPYGAIGSDNRFAEAFARWLSGLWAEGTEASLKAYTNEGTTAQ
ncbi:MAG: mannitol dehydrogenase family protein [Pseudomonadota bacterium]